MNNEVLMTIENRRAHRAYEPKQLSEDQLQAIINAALASPSAVNAQPWHFSVVQDQDLLNRIHQESRTVAMKREAGKRSPRYDDPTFQVFYHAPTVIFLSGNLSNPYAKMDCGIAVQNIALAAKSLGLGSVILGLPADAFLGDAKEELEQKLQFPEGYGFQIAISIGIATDTKAAHEKHPEKVSIIR